MPLLASFNFQVSLGALTTVVAVLLGFMIALGALRSMILAALSGGFIGAAACLIITGISGPSGVDPLAPERLALAAVFAIVGLVLGATAGTIGETFRGRQARQGPGKQGGGSLDL